MSTRLGFDLQGFARAIEQRDWRYRLALYADDAEVHVDSPGSSSMHALHGKEAIRAWIERTCAPEITHEVLSSTFGDGWAELTEKCSRSDGLNMVYMRSANIQGGRIFRETITLVREDGHVSR